MGGAEVDELLPSGLLRRNSGTHGTLVEILVEPSGEKVRFRLTRDGKEMVNLRVRADQATHLGNLLIEAARAPAEPAGGAS